MKLQFNKQKYQIDCVNNIVSIFENIENGEPFATILQNHARQNKYPEKFSQRKNIDITMETGTGKTFTFINTMFELNKQFGYKKFIILVPSVAIAEGVKKNLTITPHAFNKKDNVLNKPHESELRLKMHKQCLKS